MSGKRSSNNDIRWNKNITWYNTKLQIKSFPWSFRKWFSGWETLLWQNYFRRRATGGHSGSVPPQIFVVPRKNYFKHKIKTKILLPKNKFLSLKPGCRPGHLSKVLRSASWPLAKVYFVWNKPMCYSAQLWTKTNCQWVTSLQGAWFWQAVILYRFIQYLFRYI